jgi:hypothetical protein
MLRENRRQTGAPYYLDLDTPTAIQMKSVVKGNDRYKIRPKRPWLWLQQFGYALLVLVLLIVSFGALFIIAEALR